MRSGIRLVSFAVWGIAACFSSALAVGAEPAGRVQEVPLGETLSDQKGDRYFGVYVPTKFGGELTIKTTSGTVSTLTGPDGRSRQNGQDVGLNQHGWYTFAVAGSTEPYTVETSFVQVGQSARRPFNFYYWPTKSDAIHEPWAGGNARVDTMRAFGDDLLVASPGGYIAPGQDIVRAGPNGILETPVSAGDDSTWFPNQYDDLTWRGADGTLYTTPSPMLKYDQIFHSQARAYEAANSQNQDIQRWPGHCLGGAVSSIMLNEPTPAPGSGMSRDELKALWAELGENHYNHQIGDYANEIVAGPPRPGYDDTDRSVARFHSMLERHVRGEKKALLGNLRAFPPRGTANEVWNHGIGKYTAVFHGVPGKGPRAVRLEVALEANSGSSLNGQDDKPRVINYVYTMVYGLDGMVDQTNISGNDWVSVGGEGMYAPLNLLEVVNTRWAGHNPYVTEANVRALDIANGGGHSRMLTSTAPTFSPVVAYEAGRAPFGPAPAASRGRFSMFGGREEGVAANSNANAAPRRGGFFGLFGR